MSRSVRTSLVLVLLLLTMSAGAQPAAHMPERREPPGDSAAPVAAPEEHAIAGTGADPTGGAAPDTQTAGAPDAGSSSAALHEHGSATGYETTVEAPAPTSAASAESIRDR